jgi:DnaJ family protein A protein 2
MEECGNPSLRQPKPTTPSIQVPLNLTLEQFYLGDTFATNHTRQVLCLQWAMCPTQAPDCLGRGIKSIHPQITMQADDSCVSRGKRWAPNCSSCPQKTEPVTIELTVEVAPGLRAGENISFTGVMDERLGSTAGDLHFILYEVAHAQYHRDRDDLYKTVEVPLVDALTGFSATLTDLGGKEFVVQATTVTASDHVMRVPGKGMPRRNGPGVGDLYLTFEVDFPDELTVSPENKDAKLNVVVRGDK